MATWITGHLLALLIGLSLGLIGGGGSILTVNAVDLTIIAIAAFCPLIINEGSKRFGR